MLDARNGLILAAVTFATWETIWLAGFNTRLVPPTPVTHHDEAG